MVVWVGGIVLRRRVDSMKAWVVAGMKVVVEMPRWDRWSVVPRIPLVVQVVRIQQDCAFESSGCLQLRSEVGIQRSHHSRPMSGHRLHWTHCTSWYRAHQTERSALV